MRKVPVVAFVALVVACSVDAPSRDGAPAAAASGPARPLASLDLAQYAGTWHQVAHIPNRFQRQCVRDTTATYALQPDGTVQVTNRCVTGDGKTDEVVGTARPRGDARLQGTVLSPASLEVAFAPRWTRWLPMVWGRYDVVHWSDDRRVAIVTEPSREYLWVLSRDRALDATRWADIEARVDALGIARNAWQRDR